MSAAGYVRPTTSLFISGLAEDANELILGQHFERIDRTIRIRGITIRRNYQTGRSRGTATIEFVSPEDAEKALKMANYTEISGKEIHLMWYKQGGIKDRVTGNIFVRGLAADFKSKDLYALLSTYGKISSCRVNYDSKGMCRGYGYTQFETKEAADKALAELNGKEIHGSKLELCPFKVREARPSSITMYNNLFVKCIPKKFTSEDLRSLFATYGEITSAVVIKDRTDDPENKGFGFVCFKKFEDAKTAEEKLKGYQIEGQALYVCRALSSEEHRKKLREERLRIYKDRNVYVKNFADGTTDEDLRKAFEPFGKVESARVMVERREDPATGKTELKSLGYGFICFSNKEDAKKAVTAAAEGQQMMGRNLTVAIAEKKEERQAKYIQGFYPMQMGMYGPPPNMYHHPRSRRPPHVFISECRTKYRKEDLDR